MKELEEPKIGQIIYSENRYSGILQHAVTKITPTQVVLDGGTTRIKKPLKERNYEIGSSGWNQSVYTLHSKEMEKRYNKQNQIRVIKSHDLSKFNSDVVQEIYNIIVEAVDKP